MISYSCAVIFTYEVPITFKEEEEEECNGVLFIAWLGWQMPRAPSCVRGGMPNNGCGHY